MKNTIVIVDDHTLIAKALKSIISNFEHFEVLYECENGVELIEKLKSNKNLPSVILLDISMPVMDGFETAKWLNENHPEIKIMALSMQNDDESVIKMIKNGANGYLLKNTHPADLEKALQKIVLVQAEVAHLVEHDLAKVGVAGSSPVFRSKSRRWRDFF